MQSRIQPRQNVREVRENLLIAQVAQHKGKVVPACGRSFLPRQLQIHLKMQDLLKEKEKEKLCLAEAKKEYDILAASIKTKSKCSSRRCSKRICFIRLSVSLSHYF